MPESVPLFEKDRSDYASLTDEEVVALAQQGDANALVHLLETFKSLVRIKARSYFLIGADHEDLVQEGMIGLYKAVRDFRADRQTAFRAFADLCVKRQIITAIKTATRQKHMPLNSYVSLNKPLFEEDNERTLMDIVERRATNPEEIYINQEEYRLLRARISDSLSGFERQVLGAFLDGQSYQQIADSLNRQVKAIDNALQRIKKKLNNLLDQID